MVEGARMIELAQDGDTLVVTPSAEQNALAFNNLEVEAANVVATLARSDGAKNLVVDFANVVHFGSMTVAALLRFREACTKRGGKMVLSNVSDPAVESLKLFKLDKFWTFHGSREEALAAVSGT